MGALDPFSGRSGGGAVGLLHSRQRTPPPPRAQSAPAFALNAQGPSAPSEVGPLGRAGRRDLWRRASASGSRRSVRGWNSGCGRPLAPGDPSLPAPAEAGARDRLVPLGLRQTRAGGEGAAGEDAGAVGPAVRLRAQGAAGDRGPLPAGNLLPPSSIPADFHWEEGSRIRGWPRTWLSGILPCTQRPGLTVRPWDAVTGLGGSKGEQVFRARVWIHTLPTPPRWRKLPILTLLLGGLPSAFLPPASQLATDAQSSFGHAPSASMTTPTPGFLSASWLALS